MHANKTLFCKKACFVFINQALLDFDFPIIKVLVEYYSTISTISSNLRYANEKEFIY